MSTHPCSPVPSFFLTDSLPHWLHCTSALQQTGRHTFSVSRCHLVALDTKASIPQEKQYTFSHTIIYPPGLQIHKIRLEKNGHAHLIFILIFLQCVQSISKFKSPAPWSSSAPPSSQMSWSSDCLHSELHTAHLFPTMPTTVCVSAQNGRPIGQRQLSAPWTALTLQGRQLLCTLLPNGWRHDPRDFRLSYRTIVVPVGIIVYSNTVHTCVHFLDWYVNYCDCHCCP